jgi:hypothetical protein
MIRRRIDKSFFVQPLLCSRVSKEIYLRMIERYVAFFLGAFLVIGSISGCHNSAAPTSPNVIDTTSAIDTLPVKLGSFPLEISVKNIIIEYYDSSGKYYGYGNTVYGKLGSGKETGRYDIAGITGSNSTIITSAKKISALYYYNEYPRYGYRAAFLNLSYTTLSNDTILIQLHGFEASKHISYLGYSYSFESQVQGTVGQGHWIDFENHSDNYYQCTDSTELDIKIHL